MVEIQFDKNELGFILESIKRMDIKGADAPFVTSIMQKIVEAGNSIKPPVPEKSSKK